MSRRKTLPWSPTSLPQMRRQWCEVLDAGLDQLRGRAAGGEETAAALAELIPQAEQDLSGLARSTLYWVVRDMVDLATGAAVSLPEWSPAAAIPQEYGLLCWAKPPAVFDWPVPGRAERLKLPVDAMMWGIREGRVGVSCAFRTDRIADQLGAGWSRFPLVSHAVGMWDLEEPVSHRLDDGTVSPLSVLGTAWLLMDQSNITTSRQLRSSTEQSVSAPSDADVVSIIELRRTRSGPDSVTAGAGSDRKINKRFLVSGHWRQQACGPGRTLRKPRYINAFLKGPEDAPLLDPSDRVYLWRR